MIDVLHEIDTVRRAVADNDQGGPDSGPTHTVTVSRGYDAAVDELWDACTNPDRIARWFLPVTGELREGGHYQLEGNAGGTVQRCDPPNGFTATWEYADTMSLVELTLIAEPGDRTRFSLAHTVSADDHWAEFGPGAVGVGWDMCLHGLALHLSSGTAVDPAASAGWLASADGKQFVALTSERWGAAHRSAGVEESTARAAAARTAAAYTPA